MKYGGFSLIECMVYCALISILFIVWFHGMVVAHASFAQQSARTTTLSNVYAAHDMLVRDIREAPAPTDQWRKCANTELVWRGLTNDIGWRIHNNTLLRTEGFYDTKKQVWRKKKQSVALFDVMGVRFTKHGTPEYISAIECELVLQTNEKIQTRVSLRNGVVHD